VTSEVKEFVLLSLLNIDAVGSKVSFVKSTINGAFIFGYHTNKIQKHRTTSFL